MNQSGDIVSSLKSVDTPIDVLKVDRDVVLKDIKTVRPCHSTNAVNYCREWATIVQKAVYGTTKSNTDTSKTDDRSRTKIAALELIKELQNLLLTSMDNSQNIAAHAEIIDEIVGRVQEWIGNDSRMIKAGQVEPLTFDPTVTPTLVYGASPKDDLLHHAVLERSSFQIPASSFDLLQNHSLEVRFSMDRDEDEYRTPPEVEIERDILNADIEKGMKKFKSEYESVMKSVWNTLQSFLDHVGQLAERRKQLLQVGAKNTNEQFEEQHAIELAKFEEYWSTVASTVKKSGGKKGKTDPSSINDQVSALDDAFKTFWENFRKVNTKFLNDVFLGICDRVQNDLVVELVETFNVDLRQLLTRMKSSDGNLQGQLYSDPISICTKILDDFPQLQTLFNSSVSSFQGIISSKHKEILEEAKQIEEEWTRTFANGNAGSQAMTGRLEKALNRDFRKRIKRTEASAASYRSTIVNEIDNLFPVPLFATVIIKVTTCFLLEGEIAEAFSLAQLVKTYEEEFEMLTSRKEMLIDEYAEGVVYGELVLNGILGMRFLEEARRITAEHALLKKEAKLFASEPSTKSAKKKKKKKKANDQSSTQIDLNSTDPSSPAESPRPGSPQSVKPSEPSSPKPNQQPNRPSQATDTLKPPNLPIPADISSPSAEPHTTVSPNNPPLPNASSLPTPPYPATNERVSTLSKLTHVQLFDLIQKLETENHTLRATCIHAQQTIGRYSQLLQGIQLKETQWFTREKELLTMIESLKLKITDLEKEKSGSKSGSGLGIGSSEAKSRSFKSNQHRNRINETENSGNSRVRCGNCGAKGHVSKDCSESCRYCGESGHLSEECAQRR
ncbi:hypothetical protein BKA69DRAFT_1038067 [Paraphysoderma sedebokerense]|nr:hypothetical protein BKA69DRAFT_1038067 [Paraphysoderma sedebokerense]